PDVRPVFRDIDRDVSHDPYAPFICILSESLPLSKKQVLGKHPEEKLVFMFHIKRVKSSTFPQPVLIGPFHPGITAMRLFNCHIQCKVMEPVTMTGEKSLQFTAELFFRATICCFKQRHFMQIKF